MTAAAGWIAGRFLPVGDPQLRAVARTRPDDPCCYTSARVSRGHPWWLEDHVHRLCRDAHTLRIGEVDPREVERALRELGAACFARSEGVVRVQARRADGRPQISATARPLGPEPAVWRTQLFGEIHPGPSAWGGAKRNDEFLERAREAARGGGVDEFLLADRGGRLVEGARSNLLWVDAAGALFAVPLARGAVAGVALARLRQLGFRIPERDLETALLPTVRELFAVNAVRGAHAVVQVGDRPVGRGRAGAWAQRMAAALGADAAGAAAPKMG